MTGPTELSLVRICHITNEWTGEPQKLFTGGASELGWDSRDSGKDVILYETDPILDRFERKDNYAIIARIGNGQVL